MIFCFKWKFCYVVIHLVHGAGLFGSWFYKNPYGENEWGKYNSLLRCFAVELWRFISSTVLNGKLLCFRMDASVRSWIWWATMWGRDWMSWRGKRSHASGCCWRLNWTAPMHRVSVFMYYSSEADEREKLFTQMLVVIAGVQMDHVFLLKQFEHLDPNNQNTFEAKDLELLIVTVTPIPNMLKCEKATKKITNQEHRLTSNQCILVWQLHLTFQMLVDKILNFLLFLLIRL